MKVVKCPDRAYARISDEAARGGIHLSEALENLVLGNEERERGSGDAGEAVISAAGSVPSEGSPVGMQSSPNDPSHRSVPSTPDQHHEEVLAALQSELSRERARREALEAQLEEPDASGQLVPDDSSIEAALVQPMIAESEPAQEKPRREPIFRFTFLDGLFGPDPD